MRNRLLFIVVIWLIADAYFFQAIQTLTTNTYVAYSYWLLDVILVAGMLLFAFNRNRAASAKVTSWFMVFMLISLVPKIAALPFLLLEDITRGVIYAIRWSSHSAIITYPLRQKWVSELALIISAIPFFGLIYGVIGGAHNYRVHKENLYFDDLPDEFDGFTITQLSDIHSGSFESRKGVQKGVEMVNAQKSDLILFTGDLVNSRADEMDNWIDLFATLKAPFGKYSVLGNHDYGDYVKWENNADKDANLASLKNVHKKIGFKLLLNEAVNIEKNGQHIALIGVENWGSRFHQYGDLDKATERVPDKEFKILMSHDPSHWDAVTLDHKKHIHLSLAGHTHGMQFGIELFGFKWSPVKYVYPQWAGIYKKQGKYLYVNRGFGFLGYPGRVGIWPEITVITLKKKA